MGNDFLAVVVTIMAEIVTVLIGRAAEKAPGKKPEKILDEEV